MNASALSGAIEPKLRTALRVTAARKVELLRGLGLSEDDYSRLGYQVNPWYPAGMFYDEKPWRSDRYFGYGQTFDTNWNQIYKSARLSEPIAPTDELKRFASEKII